MTWLVKLVGLFVVGWSIIAIVKYIIEANARYSAALIEAKEDEREQREEREKQLAAEAEDDIPKAWEKLFSDKVPIGPTYPKLNIREPEADQCSIGPPKKLGEARTSPQRPGHATVW